MAKTVDRPTRIRIAAHVRQVMKERTLSAADVHRTTGLSEATVSRILSDHGSIGLDVVLALVRRLHIDANRLLNHDPPAEFFGPGQDPFGGKKGGPGSDGMPRVAKTFVRVNDPPT